MSRLFSGVVVLAVMVFVMRVSVWVMDILRSAQQRYRALYAANRDGSFSETLMCIEPGQRRVLSAVVMVVIGMASYGIGNAFLGVLGMALGYCLPGWVITHLRTRRMRTFHKQLVTALQTIANALRAGMSFGQSVEHVARESLPPLGPEFGLLVKEIKLGVPVEEALNHLSRRVPSQHLQLVVVSTNIARTLGGNLAEMFETLSSTLQERFRLEGRIDALTAQGKLQGWFVAAMPLVLGWVFNRLRPDLTGPMMHHAFGWVLAGLVVLMEALGFLLIRRIVHVDV